MSAKHISSREFHELLSRHENVLVDFWAPWCPDCVRITEAYDQLAKEYHDQLCVVKVNIDDEKELAQQQAVKAIPSLVLYRNGQEVDRIMEPESKAIMDAFIGLSMETKKKDTETIIHDTVIIGGGPAGYTAALYAARAGLNVLLLEKLAAGGQMALTSDIDNYPGFEKGIDGISLAQKMKQQAERFGAKTELAEVFSVNLNSSPKEIRTNLGTFLAKTVIIATGANPKQLEIPGEKEWIGRGVHYCAACDGMFYKGKTVVVVGGGNSAAEDALLLSRIAKKVILVHRRDTLRATKVYHDPLMQAENVEFCWNSSPVELCSQDEKFCGIVVKSTVDGEQKLIDCDGVFVSIGRKPAAGLFLGQLEMTPERYIKAGEDTKTSIDGVFAAGDVRTKALRQVVTAVADGALAVTAAEEYLASL